MPVYIIEPAAEAVSTPDYGSGISGIRSELSSIDTDTTSIAASLATMATNSTNISTKINTITDKITIIADKVTIIADNQTTIADKQTAMETYQKKLKELGEGDGIHVISPYEYFGLISIYKRLIEEGKILDEPTIQKSAVKEAKRVAERYLNDFKDLPKMF